MYCCRSLVCSCQSPLVAISALCDGSSRLRMRASHDEPCMSFPVVGKKPLKRSVFRWVESRTSASSLVFLPW